MKHGLDLTEVELMDLAEKQLKLEGLLPKFSFPQRRRSFKVNENGHYVFTFQWEAEEV